MNIIKRLFKKKFFLVIFIIAGFIIPISQIKAYGIEVSPMLTYTKNINFKTPIGTDYEPYYNIAMNFKNANCSGYDYYVIWHGKHNVVNYTTNLYCFNSADDAHLSVWRSYNDFALEIYFNGSARQVDWYNTTRQSNTTVNGKFNTRVHYGNVSNQPDLDFYYITNYNKGIKYGTYNYGGFTIQNSFKINNNIYNIGDIVLYKNSSNTLSWSPDGTDPNLIQYNYIAGFNSALDDKKSQITLDLVRLPTSVRKYNFKIELNPNDYANPITPSFLNYELYYKSATDVHDTFRPYDNSMFTFNYQIKNEYGQLVLYGEVNYLYSYNPTDDKRYKVVLNFNNYDNGNYQIYHNSTAPNNGNDANFMINWTSNTLEFSNMQKHTWNNNYTMAVLSTTNANLGAFRMYLPMYATINENVLFKAFNYNFSSNTKLGEIGSNISTDYWNYYDFNFDFANNKVIILQRKQSNENVDFYLPYDVNVYYAENNYNIEITTPDGITWIDKPNDVDGYENVNDLFKNIDNLLSFFGGFIEGFMGILNYFFLSLNVNIRNVIVGLFTIIVITAIIANIRR